MTARPSSPQEGARSRSPQLYIILYNIIYYIYIVTARPLSPQEGARSRWPQLNAATVQGRPLVRSTRVLCGAYIFEGGVYSGCGVYSRKVCAWYTCSVHAYTGAPLTQIRYFSSDPTLFPLTIQHIIPGLSLSSEFAHR